MEVDAADRLINELNEISNSHSSSTKHIPVHVDGAMDEEDELVHEIEVVLNHDLSDDLFVLQYPLRPQWRPYDHSMLEEIRYKPGVNVLEMQYGLSHDEQMEQKEAKSAVLDANGQPIEDPTKKMSNYTVKSSVVPMKSNYLVGVYSGKRLTVTPLNGVLQMRPSFAYIDEGEAKKRKKETELQSVANAGDRMAAGIRASMDDMDSSMTGADAMDVSESSTSAGAGKGGAPALKPLQVQVKKKESQKAIQMRLKSYNYLKQLENEEQFVKLDFVNRDRMDALRMFNRLNMKPLFSSEPTLLSKQTYAESINPVVTKLVELPRSIASSSDSGAINPSKSRAPPPNPFVASAQEEAAAALHTNNSTVNHDSSQTQQKEATSISIYAWEEHQQYLAKLPPENNIPPVLSMHTIQQMTLKEQVLKILSNTHVIRHSDLMNFVTVKDPEKVIPHIRNFAALTQGVWVLRSEFFYKGRATAIRNWILLQFGLANDDDPDSYYLTKKRIAERCSVSIQFVSSIVDPLTTPVPFKGLKLKHAPDRAYMAAEPAWNAKYTNWWKATRNNIEKEVDNHIPIIDEDSLNSVQLHKQITKAGATSKKSLVKQRSRSKSGPPTSSSPPMPSSTSMSSMEMDATSILASASELPSRNNTNNSQSEQQHSSSLSYVPLSMSQSLKNMDSTSMFEEISPIGLPTTLSPIAKLQLDSFLNKLFKSFGVLTLKTIMEKAAIENQSMESQLSEVPSLTTDLITQELLELNSLSIRGAWVLNQSGDPSVEPFRSILIELYKKSDHVTRQDAMATFRSEHGKEPSRVVANKIMYELSRHADTPWAFKRGDGSAAEKIPDTD